MSFDSNEYLLGSDFHLRLESLESSRKLLDLAYNICKERSIPLIICGDFFHTKAVIRSECLNLALEYFRIPDWKVIMIVGNHDFENSNCERHSLEAFKGIPNLMLIDQQDWLCGGKIHLTSYHNEEVFKSRIKDSKAEYLICHQGISGFKMNNTKTDESSEITPKDLKSFKSVFAGHYHIPHTKGNVTYVGSPYQQNFGEKGQSKRFILFNVAENTQTDISLDEYFPQYHIFTRDADTILRGGDSIIPVKDIDHVRFDITGTKEACNKITKQVIIDTYGLKCNVKVNTRSEDSQVQATIEESLDYSHMFMRWLKFQKTSLNKEEILKKALELIDAHS